MAPHTALSRQTIWTFSVGDITTSAPMAIIAFFQLFFLTDVAGLNPALAAWPILIGKLWDAFNDPLAGFLADRVHSRFGRRRVLLMAATGPVGLSFFLMWLVPPWEPSGLLLYYTLVYVVFDTTLTVVHIAYNSLAAGLSSDYDEQSSLHGVRMVYSIGGALIAVILGTVLQWFIPDLRRVFAVLGVALSLLVAVPPILVLRATRGRDASEPPVAAGRPVSELLSILRNRPFWTVMGLYLSSWTAVSVIAAVLVYFARYNLRVPHLASYYVLTAQGMAILFIPLVVLIARRSDKRIAVAVGFGSMIPLLLAIGLSRPGGHGVVFVYAALLGLGIATAYVTPWSMIPDVIQWDERSTGSRREGSYYAVVSFFQKAGTAAALWAMAQVLAANGYVTPVVSAVAGAAEDLPVQPPSALRAIRLFISLVPSILLLASLVCAALYPITRDVQRKLRSDIDGESPVPAGPAVPR